ncbi:hypothetical protein ENUP19_0010G0011 [Entamoeba nuttalli]|uniref:Transmembrane protein n=2 Tax=Entamoeba nuttalli TaxID=412467 RepID=K2H377_ENTNP|nr:hypothetical protein ENU1_215140 [Entamoeba nuttalli P19]EKE36889.1 hypothetical protein ENU1_215140 [Entamoeba nuttalli P19]|eukprot:XP_008860781.1 hypothetical protein ENU1_215140 [Entamoeba nuttalli P19]
MSEVPDDKNAAVGYICAVISVVCFGSNFTPVKKFPTGDGFFYQWVMAIGVLLSGIFTLLIVNSTKDSPFVYFEPFAMIGGFIWSVGNVFSVPAIQMLGLSMGQGIWGICNMITGWVTGTFGWFGIHADKSTIKTFWLNCVGAAIAVCAVPFFIFIKTSTKEERQASEKLKKEKDLKEDRSDIELKDENNEHSCVENEQSEEGLEEKHRSSNQKDMNEVIDTINNTSNTDLHQIVEVDEPVSTPIERISPLSRFYNSLPFVPKKILGICCTVIVGVSYGAFFLPPKYLQDNSLGSPNGIDYVLPFFLGLFLTATAFFGAYTFAFRNNPFVYPQTIVPALLSGIITGIGTVTWFIAANNIPYSASFPIITSGPILLSSVWGIVVFGEIRGWKNFLLFGCGTVTLIAGIVCIVVSS